MPPFNPTAEVIDAAEDEATKNGIAVLVLDFQNEFVSPGGKLHNDVKDMMEKTGMVEKLSNFVAMARENGAIIIHSPVIIPPGGKIQTGDGWDPHAFAQIEGLFEEGTWNAEMAKGIDQREEDIVLQGRKCFWAFDGTNLADILKERNIKSFFAGGFLTNMCVEESIHEASQIEGLDVYALTDGCAAKSPEEHFAATNGTFPLLCSTCTCHQAASIVRSLATRDGVPPALMGNIINNSRAKRASLALRNTIGERRNTFLQAARHSAYMKMVEQVPSNDLPSRTRLSIATLLNYYPEKEEPDEAGFDPACPIFMMVGSQRSGSNWLRTMLSEREDLAGPHPPHILRDFFPILDKFGDLENEENLHILVDHVCTFVEKNQVTWLDKHGRPVKFDRERVLDVAISTVDIMRMVHKDKDIHQKYYLIAIFDEIQNLNAIACDKRTWICKSMGNSQYHDMLLTYYGEERLRYIYLVRDCRDVALSFMKSPVGDCHYYAIISKWTKLQRHALHVLSVSESLVYQVRYENLLKDNAATMEGINEFMGKRKFGKVLRRGSVAILNKVEDMMNTAAGGVGAQQASVLSYKFKNLTRGESFRQGQFQKWRKEMNEDDILLIESVAHEMMTRLGYEPHIVGVTRDALVFTDEQIEEFKVLNELGIKKMMEDLQQENPEDAKRRIIQKTVLEQDAVMLSSTDDENGLSDVDEEDEFDDGEDKIKKMHPYKWPRGASKVGYLTDEQVSERFQVKETSVLKSGKFSIKYSVAMQRGYYPSNLDKPCQDAFLDSNYLEMQWLCVFDGHGPTGHDCAEYARDNVINNYNGVAMSKDAIGASLLNVNKGLHGSDIDDSNSGTTALTVLVKGGELLVANVGDCRCVVVSLVDGKLIATALTSDQTPHRKDELERIKKAGGLVMTSEQYDNDEPMHENWLDGDSPPRIWHPNRKEGKFPGCAFTRSIGDQNGEGIGVTADAEFSKYTLSDKDQFLLIGSDGIFEFISDAEAARICSLYDDPIEVCRALVGESYRRWIKREERTDDITVIAGFISKDD